MSPQRLIFFAVFAPLCVACAPLCGAAHAQTAPVSPASPTPAAKPTIAPAKTTPALVVPAEPTPDKPIDLAQAIAIAWTHHGDVGVSQQQLQAARERVTEARSPLFPQANIQGSYVKQSHTGTSVVFDTTGNGSTTVVTNRDTTHQVSAVLSQNIFDMGLTRAQVKEARAGVDVAQAGLGIANSNVAFNVATAYFEQLRQEKLVDLSEKQVANAKQHIDQVQAQIDAGTSAKVDIQPVQVAMAQAQYNLTQARGNARVAETKLRDALGLDRGPALKLVDVTTTVPPTATLESYETLARTQRPDLQQAAANVLSSQAALAVTKINNRPQFNVTANYEAGFFNSPTHSQWVLDGELTVPLFDAGRRKASIREASANLEADRIRYKQLDKDASADVEAAYESFASATEKINSANALAEQARVNLEVASEKYRQGLGIALEVFDAEIQLFSAENTAIQALYDYYEARAGIDRSVGTWALPAVASPNATVLK